jgi:hypothetical protein
MTQRTWRCDRGEAALCPTYWEHEVEISRPGCAVSVIALSCPGCTRPSATEELSQIVAARQRTLAGVASLPPGTRAGLAATGTLDRLYQGTIAEVREAPERCRAWLGVELPAGLDGATRPAVPDGAYAARVLNTATAWLAALNAQCDGRHKICDSSH